MKKQLSEEHKTIYETKIEMLDVEAKMKQMLSNFKVVQENFLENQVEKNKFFDQAIKQMKEQVQHTNFSVEKWDKNIESFHQQLQTLKSQQEQLTSAKMEKKEATKVE